MRSDFWSLPYAARQAIQRGEHEADSARRRAFTIGQLQEENKKLSDQLEAMQAEIERLRENITALWHESEAGRDELHAYLGMTWGQYQEWVTPARASLDRQGK